MTYFPLQPRYNVYTDSLGEPLDNGYIYIGETGLDPIANPVKVSWDESGLYPVTFPVRTLNGYPLRDGIPAQMYIEQSHNYEYSILINDEDGDEVFSSSTGLGGYFGEDAGSLGGQPASYYAADAEVVHIDGDETLNDEKTFSQSIVVANDFGIRLTNLSGTNRLFLAQDTNDDFLLGSTSAATLVRSDGTFTHNGDTIWTSGNDSALAHLAGVEDFTGVKTFNASVNFATDVFSYWGSGSSTNYIRIGHTSANGDFKLTPYLASVAQTGKVFWFNGTAQEWQIDSVNQYAVYHEGNDSALAHLAGAETFTGTKTFSVYQILNNNVYLNAKESGGTNRAIIGMSSSDIVTLGNGTNNLDIYSGGTIAAIDSYLQLDNNYYLRGLTSGAATRGLIGITSGDIVDVGSGLQVTNLRSSGTLTFNTSDQVWTSVEFGFSESSFTPVLYGVTTAGTGTYTAQYGRYQKVGNWVHFRLYLTWTAHTGTGQMRISGLPYTSEVNNCAVTLVPNNITYTGDFPIALVLASSTEIGLYNAATGAGLSILDMDTSANVAITGSYQAVAA